MGSRSQRRQSAQWFGGAGEGSLRQSACAGLTHGRCNSALATTHRCPMAATARAAVAATARVVAVATALRRQGDDGSQRVPTRTGSAVRAFIRAGPGGDPCAGRDRRHRARRRRASADPGAAWSAHTPWFEHTASLLHDVTIDDGLIEDLRVGGRA
jgi:hypothetical protein